jgi:hypothetical protein
LVYPSSMPYAFVEFLIERPRWTCGMVSEESHRLFFSFPFIIFLTSRNGHVGDNIAVPFKCLLSQLIHEKKKNHYSSQYKRI